MNDRDRASLEPDRDQIEIFTDAVFRHATPSTQETPHIVSLRSFFDNTNKVYRLTPLRLGDGPIFLALVAEAMREARNCARTEQATVFCPPICAFRSQSAKEEDVVEGYTLTVECDAQPNQARERLEGLLGAATAVVASGGTWINGGEAQDKLHLHWRLHTPARGDELTKLKRARRLAAEIVGADLASVPICHPIRWPGSWHRKAAPRLCRIVSLAADFEIELDAALATLEAAAPRAERTTTSENAASGAEWDALIADILAGRNYHDPITRLAAKLVTAGMAEGAAVNLLRGLMENGTAPHDARWQSRYDHDVRHAVDTAGAKYRFGKQATSASAATPLWNPWQAQAAPPFPLDTLPNTIRQRVLDRAETIGCDPAAIAMSAFASLSAMADHRIALKPKKYDEYHVRANLWILLYGAASTRKTSVIDDAEYYPRKADSADAARHAEAVKEQSEEKPADIPPARVRVIKNATSEALVELLAEQDCGCTLFTDEMSGWIGTWDKYVGGTKGGAAERAVWLLAHGGGPYSQRRVKAQRAARNLCVSILGTIQPDRMKEIGKLATDGLLQRFIPVVLRDASPGKDLPRSPATTGDYADLLGRVGGLIPQIFMLDDEARKIYFKMEEDSVVVGKANDPFGSFYAKQPRTLLVITLLLHLCEIAEDRGGITDFVSEETIARADHILREFILPHARLFYDADPRIAQDNQQIAAAILKHPEPTIKLRDLTRATRSMRGLDESLDVQKKLFPFIVDEWLTPVAQHPANRVWTINPNVRGRFAEDLEAHIAAEKRTRDSIIAAANQRRQRVHTGDE